MKKPWITKETQQKCVKPETKNSILYPKKLSRKSHFQVSLQNSLSKTWMETIKLF